MALSEWMTAIGDEFATRIRPSDGEIRNAIRAAGLGAGLDPRNAYWHQMLAALDHSLGDDRDAKAEWFSAASLDTWNDYQSNQLLDERGRIARAFGAAQSWQLADVYYQRSANAVDLIAEYSRALLRASPIETDDGLVTRAATVLNGALLRQGSKSIRIGMAGARMSEIACHPDNMVLQSEPHRLFLQRINMQNRLRQIGHPEMADQVHKCYNETDAWDAFEDEDDASSFASESAFLSLLYAGLPNMLLAIGLLGLCLWIAGYAMRKVEKIGVVPAAVAGLVLAIVTYATTRLPLAAIVPCLCSLFLTLGPKQERRVRIDDLGPMFSFTTGTLGLVFMLLFGTFVVGAGAPAIAVLAAQGDVPSEYFGGSGVLLGLSIMVLAILLLLAPLFATALRIGTAFVLGLALRKFGAFLGYLSLAGLVVGAPVCIYQDRGNSVSLERLVSNEPVYYLTLQR
ncbi:MAG TPA: hypothetical protein VMI31_02975 [Fimbriimonadaceae bacterium]|nr:hypothetical protein [Fimbriimonadaceae bacterium]